MHIKRMHEMIEKLSECALSELNKGIEHVDTKEFGAVIDMIKALSESEYKARISKAMECAEKEDEAEETYMMKRFKEEYGDDEGERRYYDDYRYKRSGRFAPKGRGSYMPRRGYDEPMYYMSPYMYREHEPEYYRDMDRKSRGVMYYTETNSANTGTHNGNSNMNTMRDGREGRSGQSRRSYIESKEMHKGNTADDKNAKMKELERYMQELSSDITEMIADSSPEERTLLKNKMQVLTQKL